MVKALTLKVLAANYGQIIKENRESTLGWQFASDDIADKFVEAWNKANDPETKLDANGVIAQLIQLGVLEGGSNKDENVNVEAGTINGSTNLSAALAAVTFAATNNLDLKTGADVSTTGKGLYIVTAHSKDILTFQWQLT